MLSRVPRVRRALPVTLPVTLLWAFLWTLAALLPLCALSTLGGCGSTGTSRSTATTRSGAGLRADLSRLVKEIDVTIWTLDGVVDPGAKGLRAAYDGYLRQLDRLQTQADQASTSAESFRSNAATYLATWGSDAQGMRNQQIRARSEERRAEAQRDVDGLLERLDTLKASYEGVHADLRDIGVALDNDLNPAGVAALSDVIAEIKETVTMAKSEIATVITEIDRVTQAMTVPAPAAR
jgi:hypothetical protein